MPSKIKISKTPEIRAFIFIVLSDLNFDGKNKTFSQTSNKIIKYKAQKSLFRCFEYTANGYTGIKEFSLNILVKKAKTFLTRAPARCVKVFFPQGEII